MPPPPEDTFGLVGETLAEKYTVDRLVASGGFGVVYRATHTALKSPFALKILKVPTDLTREQRRDFIDDFRREGEIVSKLAHPAIVRATDFGVVPMPAGGEAPWMALEWIDGETLADDLTRRRREGMTGRTPAECLALLRPVFQAVAYAHKRGVAHRDIKPSNIMLLTNAQEELGVLKVRLLDFGIAKLMEGGERSSVGDALAITTRSVGYTPRYAAPEQVSEKRTGPWTDVHALALVLTEVLTGNPALTGQGQMELALNACATQRPTPSKSGVDAGPWEAVLARALALAPAERFADAGAFLAALEAEVPTITRRVQPHEATPAATPTDVTPPQAPISTLTPSERQRPTGERRSGKLLVPLTAISVAALVLGVTMTVIVSKAGPPAPRPGPARDADPTQTLIQVPSPPVDAGTPFAIPDTAPTSFRPPAHPLPPEPDHVTVKPPTKSSPNHSSPAQRRRIRIRL